MSGVWEYKPKLFALEFIYTGQELDKIKYINENLLECKIDKFGEFYATGRCIQTVDVGILKEKISSEAVEFSNCEVGKDGKIVTREGFKVTETHFEGLKKTTEDRTLKQCLFKTEVFGKKALVICDSSGMVSVLDCSTVISPVLRAVQMVNLVCYANRGTVVLKRKCGTLRDAVIQKAYLLHVTYTILGELCLTPKGKYILLDEIEGYISKEFDHVPLEFLASKEALLGNASVLSLEKLQLNEYKVKQGLESERYKKGKPSWVTLDCRYSIKRFKKNNYCMGYGLVDSAKLDLGQGTVLTCADRVKKAKELKALWSAFKLPPVFKVVVPNSVESDLLSINANITIFYIPIRDSALLRYKGLPIKYIGCIYFRKGQGCKLSDLKYISISNQEKGNLNSDKIVGRYLGDYVNGKFTILCDLIDAKTGEVIETWKE